MSDSKPLPAVEYLKLPDAEAAKSEAIWPPQTVAQKVRVAIEATALTRIMLRIDKNAKSTVLADDPETRY